jgi:hypothetical protein
MTNYSQCKAGDVVHGHMAGSPGIREIPASGTKDFNNDKGGRTC